MLTGAGMNNGRTGDHKNFFSRLADAANFSSDLPNYRTLGLLARDAAGHELEHRWTIRRSLHGRDADSAMTNRDAHTLANFVKFDRARALRFRLNKHAAVHYRRPDAQPGSCHVDECRLIGGDVEIGREYAVHRCRNALRGFFLDDFGAVLAQPIDYRFDPLRRRRRYLD